MAVDIEKTRFHLSGLSLVLKKIDWPGVQSDLRYTPLVEVNQAINSLVVLDNGQWPTCGIQSVKTKIACPNWETIKQEKVWSSTSNARRSQRRADID